MAFSAFQITCPICSRRFSGKFFENAIELRERLEPDSKCDFTDAKIDIFQELACFLKPAARNVINKLCAGHLFELFAQVRRIDPDRLGHFAQRKLFGGMFLNEPARFPDVSRLGVIELS